MRYNFVYLAASLVTFWRLKNAIGLFRVEMCWAGSFQVHIGSQAMTYRKRQGERGSDDCFTIMICHWHYVKLTVIAGYAGAGLGPS